MQCRARKKATYTPKTMTTTVSVIKTYRVAPPPGAVVEQSLPLTFFDMMWLHLHPILQLLFFEFPCSKSHFVESVVPKLQQSLSQTLKHFFPFSGHLIYPLSPEKMPEIRYLSGDSVNFTVAESSDDFDNLVANRAESADRLYSFAAKLPPIVEESDRKTFQVFAAQVTLFPSRGVCIGLTTHHTVADAVSFNAFVARWASICKHDGYEGEGEGEALFIFDRSVVKYPTKLDSIYWVRAQKNPFESWHLSLPTNRMRAAFVFSPSEIKKLKDLVARVSDSIRISSFVALAAYMWTGLAKSLGEVAEADAEPAFFLISMDLRPRLDPPVPVNYCGNCVTCAPATIRWRELAGDKGLFLAAEAMAEHIKKRINNDKILESAEIWSPEIFDGMFLNKFPWFAVVGSSRLDLYGADFGWGKARKQEILLNDFQKYAMTLCKARNVEGGFEVCMSLPKEEMEAFGAFISQGIIKAH